ncbi:MAG: PilZ domain-containing protein [Candidatus Omnitrophica bacterium]|nr:PilZ domain-containing protein [Candidatus Omnitrophota bacterium]
MGERRKLARWQVNQHAALKLEQAAEELFCQIKDINSKGARITLNTKLPQDSRLKMSLRLSENYAVEAEVWVAWHKVINGINHYGLYFSRIKDADKDKIYKFINRYRSNGLKQEPSPAAARVEKEKGGEGMHDHRIFERFRKEFSARFIGLDGKEGQAQTFDVSAKGLGLSTTNELESKTPLEIWLDVPGSTDPLYTRGQVVWSRLAGVSGYRSGIELERADLMGVSRLLRA